MLVYEGASGLFPARNRACERVPAREAFCESIVALIGAKSVRRTPARVGWACHRCASRVGAGSAMSSIESSKAFSGCAVTRDVTRRPSGRAGRHPFELSALALRRGETQFMRPPQNGLGRDSGAAGRRALRRRTPRPSRYGRLHDRAFASQRRRPCSSAPPCSSCALGTKPWP